MKVDQLVGGRVLGGKTTIARANIELSASLKDRLKVEGAEKERSITIGEPRRNKLGLIKDASGAYQQEWTDQASFQELRGQR